MFGKCGALGSAIRDTGHSGHVRAATVYERMVGKRFGTGRLLDASPPFQSHTPLRGMVGKNTMFGKWRCLKLRPSRLRLLSTHLRTTK